MLIQVPDDVTMVRAAIAGGGFDEMEPIKGQVALAMVAPAPPANAGVNPFEVPQPNASIDLIRADGSSTRISRDALNMGPAVWPNPDC